MCYAQTIDMQKKMEGEEGFRQDIERVRDDMPSLVAEELRGIMEQVKQLAIELCPKDSGALASSISLEQGTISASNEIFNAQIYAGSDDIVNFEGQPTSQYANAAHDGHMLANGDFWEGTPFLTDALDTFESEIMDVVNRAMDALDLGD